MTIKLRPDHINYERVVTEYLRAELDYITDHVMSEFKFEESHRGAVRGDLEATINALTILDTLAGE